MNNFSRMNMHFSNAIYDCSVIATNLIWIQHMESSMFLSVICSIPHLSLQSSLQTLQGNLNFNKKKYVSSKPQFLVMATVFLHFC